ncbi:MAG: hypothetical protein ACRDZ4_04900 [Egibacteraceae bacterium]
MSQAAESTAEPGGLTTTFALVGGLISWILRLIIGSWVVSFSCTGGWLGTLAGYAVSVVFLAITLLALLASIRLYGPGQRWQWEEGELPGAVFVGIVGILLNAISLVAILAESASIPFIDPCQPR